VIDILRAIDDANLFRPYLAGDPEGSLDSWQQWLAFLRCLYGLPIEPDDHDLIRTCTGRDPARFRMDGVGFDECLLLCGRRSGKSKLIALVGAFEALFSGRESKLSPGEVGLVAVLSPTKSQSGVIHSYMRGVFDSPLLSREVTAEKQDGFTLRNGVEVRIIVGDPRLVRGFTLLAALVDETSMFGLADESKVRSDTELIRSLRPGLANLGGRLLCIATPYRASGHCYQTFKRAYGNDDCDVLCWSGPSLTMNPTLPPSVVERALAEDPLAARSEFCVTPGAFREDVDAYVSRAAVEACVVKGRHEVPPTRGIRYAAFVDVSGGRHDAAALAIAHLEGSVVVLDLLEHYPSPHVPALVVAEMAVHLKRYGLRDASGDFYSAEWARTEFEQHGISYRRVSRTEWNEGAAAIRRVHKTKSELYISLLPRLHSGQIELLDDDILVSQLSSLERRTRSGGRDVVDHPPSGHDDAANCVAGVADACVQQPRVAGAVGFACMVGPGLPSASVPANPLGNAPQLSAIDVKWREFIANREEYAREGQAANRELSSPDHAAAWRAAMFKLGRTPSPYRRDLFGF
jgi:hypothetical protein